MLELIQQKFASGEFESDDDANDFFQSIIGRPMAEVFEEAGPVPVTKRSRALDHLERISDSNSPMQNRKIAKTATGIDPDCVEAWMEHSCTYDSIKLAEPSVRKAVAVGRRGNADLIAQTLETEKVRRMLWGHIQARPFLEACHALALMLERDGRGEEANEIYEEILELNPGDNQGVRYHLFRCLLANRQLAPIPRLLEAYPDEGSASWLYLLALYEFIQGLDACLWEPVLPEEDAGMEAYFEVYREMPPEFDAANAALDVAIESNRFVPLFIGDARTQFLRVDSYRLGSPNEAVDCAQNARLLWVVAIADIWVYARLHNAIGPRSMTDLMKGIDAGFIDEMLELHAEMEDIDADLGSEEIDGHSGLAGTIRQRVLADHL